ncbi:MAG: NAD(P)-dependent glycerol-3-phosphate dehydrogenase [Candidatus Melainabacteria bacterium]|nr:NAD(P)-dependent glycerol-3-phosphate dehydrogenase [Candidatus Melainabacteria bacterium]
MKNNKIKISILGAGSWGGTLAWLLSKKYPNVNLWTFSKEEYENINKTRLLIRPKKLKLSKNVYITRDLNYIGQNSDLIIIAVPTNAFKDIIIKIKKLKIKKNLIFLSATKGITTKDNLRPSLILKKYLPGNPAAVLSGPNIALDVVSNAPIISVIACKNPKIATLLQKILSSNHFRVYLNKDVNGVEIGGALKNVIAIASGMSDGFGFNISTKAALISRGLIEITKIAIKEGANPKTLLGASGIGDLIATCCSENSRNYKVGYQFAKGKNLKKILSDLGQVAEGVETVRSMIKLAKKYKVKVPIASAVYDIIFNNKKPNIALKTLLNRPMPKYEIEF